MFPRLTDAQARELPGEGGAGQKKRAAMSALAKRKCKANRKFKPAISVLPRVSSWALTPRLGRSERGVESQGDAV